MGIIEGLVASLGITKVTIPHVVMMGLSIFLAYLAIVKKFEPLLLLPLSFGILIANMPMAYLSAYDVTVSGVTGEPVPYLMAFIYQGLVNAYYPPMVFLCIGAMTDFGPLISAPRSIVIGIGGQLGIFVAFGLAVLAGNMLGGVLPGFDGFTTKEAAAVAIIGSSDGPTAIFTATRLAPHLLPSIAIAAFSYMGLVPFIQPPIMRLLTNDRERVIAMPPPKAVTQKQKIIFPIAVTIGTLLLVPTAGALIGMLMMGNLLRESGATDRYAQTLTTHALNFLTMLVALSIGVSATAERFLTTKTLITITLGLLAFIFGTVGGVLMAKFLCWFTGGKVNPLIGNSGVSAMPMAARISQRLGLQYNPQNHLLMHAMGPIVASTIGSAIVAGIFISLYQKM